MVLPNRVADLRDRTSAPSAGGDIVIKLLGLVATKLIVFGYGLYIAIWLLVS